MSDKELLDEAAEIMRESRAVLLDVLSVLELPEATPDEFGTCYTATQRSGTVSKLKLRVRGLLRRIGDE